MTTSAVSRGSVRSGPRSSSRATGCPSLPAASRHRSHAAADAGIVRFTWSLVRSHVPSSSRSSSTPRTPLAITERAGAWVPAPAQRRSRGGGGSCHRGALDREAAAWSEQRRGLLRPALRGIAMDRRPGAARSENPDTAQPAPSGHPPQRLANPGGPTRTSAEPEKSLTNEGVTTSAYRPFCDDNVLVLVALTS